MFEVTYRSPIKTDRPNEAGGLTVTHQVNAADPWQAWDEATAHLTCSEKFAAARAASVQEVLPPRCFSCGGYKQCICMTSAEDHLHTVAIAYYRLDPICKALDIYREQDGLRALGRIRDRLWTEVVSLSIGDGISFPDRILNLAWAHAMRNRTAIPVKILS